VSCQKTIDQEAAQSQIVQPTFNKTQLSHLLLPNKTPEVPFFFSIFESSTSHTLPPIFTLQIFGLSKGAWHRHGGARHKALARQSLGGLQVDLKVIQHLRGEGWDLFWIWMFPKMVVPNNHGFSY